MARTKKNIHDIYPLTALQKGILFHSVDAEGSTAPYFAHTCFELRGELDTSALERAWQHVIDRHELLRSDVAWEKTKEPFQIVYRQVEVRIEHVAIHENERDAIQARLLAILDEDRKRAFEFGRAADTKLFLVAVRGSSAGALNGEASHAASGQTACTLHYLIWGHHHVTLDGWSASNVLGEVLLVYKALVRNEAPDLAPVPSYRTYLDWLARRDHAAAERFWRETLEGREEQGRLALPPPTSWNGEDKYAEQHVLLDASKTERLRALLQSWQVTPNTFFQGIWGMLVRAYTGAKGATIGVTISGRPADLAGAGSMVGMFINTLPLRITFPPKSELRGWLRDLQKRASDLQEHGFVSLAQVSADAARGQEPQALFEAILVFENYPMRGIADGLRDLGLQISVVEPEGMITGDVSSSQRRNNFPITLVVAPGPRLDIILAYHRDRIADEGARRLLDVLTDAVDLVLDAAEPEKLTVLSALGRAATLVTGSSTPPGVEACVPAGIENDSLPIHERIERAEEKNPDGVAVRFESETLTYRELGVHADRLANWLRGQGVRPGARVGICMPRSIDFAVAIYGVLKAGAAYVPLDPGAPTARLREVLVDASVTIVLAARGACLDLGTGITAIDLGATAITEGSSEPCSVLVHPDEAAYVIYTSGSTGKPKGVVVTHRGIDSYVGAVLERLALPDDASMAMISTVTADLGNTTLFGALASGRTLHLIAEARAFDAVAMGEYMQTHAVGALKIVPSHLKGLFAAEHPERALPRHALILGGEATPWELVSQIERLGTCRVFNHYGPTETTVGVLAGEHLRDRERVSRTLPLGTALANSRIEVLGPELKRVPPGVLGELYIAGSGLARGYLGRADLTADRFVPDPYGATGDRMYRTGDRARVLADKSLEFCGRGDDQIKLRGHRIELEEIRAAILAAPGIEDGVVLVEQTSTGSARLVAYTVAASGAARDDAALLATLEVRLPEYMVPSDVVWLDRLPLTKNGKLDRQALPKRETSEDRPHRAPSTEREVELAEIWKTVLKLERVGVDENFFKLGGDSLLGFQVVALARKGGIRFAPPDLFDHPTVASLAAYLESRVAAPSAKPKADRIAALPRPLPERLPLSPAQKRMWFEWRLAPGRASYNIPSAVRLAGPLNREALSAALSDLVSRHESLRTRFVEADGEVFQIVDAPAPLAMPIVSLECSASGSREAIRAHAEREALEPFDLATGPVVRAKVLALGPEDHVLLVTIHHIASDGWSSRILIDELGKLYSARREGRAPSLAAPGLQYADYVVWQNTWLGSAELASQVASATKRLSHDPSFLELPSDRPRSRAQGDKGGCLVFEIDRDLAGRVRALATAKDATLFMVLLSAFMVFAARHSGRRHVRVGVPHANRHRPELERVVGCFVNTQVLAAEVAGDARFDAFLAAVKAASLAAQGEQDLPFERLVEALNPPRSLSHTPVFQVTFNHQKLEASQIATMTDLRATPIEREITTSPFDLSLDTEEIGDRIVGRLTYDADLFDRATVERWAGHYRRLLEAVTSDPSTRIDRLSLLRDHERFQSLTAWNESALELPEEANLCALFAAQRALTPDAIAVEDASGALTYAELDARSNQVARALRRLGVAAEDRVGLCVDRSCSMLVGLLGILKSGAAYVPLDPEYPAERLAYVVSDAAPRAIVTQGELHARLPSTDARLLDLDSATSESSDPLDAEVVSPDQLAYCIYTSGSTGTPKGAAVSHGALVNLLWSMKERPGIEAHDRVLALTSLSFDIAGLELYLPLLVGARVVVASRETARDPSALLRFVSDRGVTVLQATPSTWRMLSEAPGFSELRLSRALSGGEALSPALAERLVARLGAIWNVYGPTETTIWSSRLMLGRGDAPRIGQPIGNTSLYVLDAAMEPTPIHAVGEIYIGGQGLARGYLGRPDLTAERFVPSPFATTSTSTGGARLYRTGDLGRWTADGVLEYVGRADQQVKIRGHRIELGEIEAALTQIEGVREAAVLALGEHDDDKRLVAYVSTSADATQDALRVALATRLPEAMIPSLWVFLPELPQTHNGKIDRKALPAPDAAEGLRAFIAPRTASEREVAEIWASVLRVPRIGVLDDFFALGGHSLLATQVISRLAKDLGVVVPLRALFEATTLEAFALRLDASRTSSAAPTIALGSRGPVIGRQALSHNQLRMWIIWRLRPESAAYNIASAFSLRGPLDRDRLGDAFRRLALRHDILRTRFVEEDGAMFQVVDDSFAPSVAFEDLRDGEGAEIRARRTAEDEALLPFDLEKGPLVRVRLLRTGDLEHVLLVTMHHIVSDGWSLQKMVDEVSASYASTSGATPPTPPDSTRLAPRFALREASSAIVEAERPLQYVDYAAWQAEWLASGERERQLAYWTAKLGSEHPVLALPADRPRPAMQSYEGAEHRFVVDAPLMRALGGLGREHGASVFMVMLAALQATLRRFTGQRDIRVGTPHANRNRTDLEGILGPMINVHVLRALVDEHTPFVDLLAQVKETCLGAHAHQELPFELLVDALQPERSLGHSPLFQVLYNHQHRAAAPAKALGDLELAPFDRPKPTTQFDLVLYTEEIGETLEGCFTYSTDLFEGATVRRFATAFTTILRAIVESPSTRIGRLRLEDAASRSRSLATGVAIPTAVPGRTFVELFEEQAARSPYAVAVEDLRGELTYAELDARANQVARVLRGFGVSPEDRVGLAVSRSASMLVGLLGILKSGAAYVPIDPDYPEDRIRYVLADAAPRAIVTEQAIASKVAGARTWCIDSEWAAAERETGEALDVDVTPDMIAYCIYTSGSTGMPKGVAVPHGALVNFLWSMMDQPGIDAEDRVVALTSISFDIAGLELYLPLLAGARVVIASRDVAHDPEALLELVGDSRVSVLQATPSTWRMLSEAPRFGELRLRRALTGGEAISPALAERLVARLGTIWNVYGPTETTIWSSRFRLTNTPSGPRGTAPTIGHPIGNTSLYVLSASMEPVAPNVVGEIYIGGLGVARGYHGRADLTAERFVPNPFSGAGDRLYRTGDLGKWSASGTLSYVGRADQQVKIRGHRIELGEIEAALTRIDGVHDAAALALSGGDRSDGDKRLVAYVVPTDRDHLAARAAYQETLRQALAARLPEHMIPSLWVLLDELPKTANGKVDRKSLPAPDASEGQQAYAPPRTELEQKLARILAGVLRLERVGLHDHFFAIGGDSIMVLKVASRAKREGIAVTPKDLFHHQTLEALAAAVSERDVASTHAHGIPISKPIELSTEALAGLGIAREAIEDVYPMTPMQQGLMTHSLLGEHGSGMYHMQNAYRVGTELDALAFDAAWSHVVRRQAILRSSFHLDDECGAIQIVHRDVVAKTRHWDLRGLAPEAQVGRMESILEEERRQGFDLSKPSALCVHLFRTADDASAFVVSHHHLLMDAWCNSLVLKEFLTCYQAAVAGRDPGASSAPPYRRYVDWLDAQDRDEATAFWRSYLEGLEAPSTLPFVRTSGADLLANDHVDDVFASLDEADTAELAKVSRSLGVTPNVVLQAAWALVLAKHAGTSDVLFGVTVAGRPTEIEGAESILGLFIQSLPLRVRVDERASVASWLRQLFEENARVRHYEYLPLPQIRAASAIRESSLFHSLFVLENAPVDDDVVREGLLVRAENAGNRTHTNYPLTVVVYPGETLALHLSYNADLFDRREAEVLLAQYRTALRDLIGRAAGAVKDVAIGGAEEVALAQGPTVDRGDDTFVARFEKQVAAGPDRVVARCGDEAWTRAELDARANVLGHGLIARGVKPDSIVALLDDRGLALLSMIIGTMKAGAAYLPLDPRHPVKRLAENLRAAKPSAIVTTDAYRDVVEAAIAMMRHDGHDKPVLVTLSDLDRSAAPTACPRIYASDRQLAYVIHTSGSTGTPKGVMVEHRGMTNNQLGKVPYFGLTEDDVIAQTASPCFDISVWQFLLAPQIGAVVDIVPDAIAADPRALFAYVAERGITVLESVPSLLRAALKESDFPPAEALRLRWVLPTGEALPADVVEKWFRTYPEIPLVNAYGPAECSDDVSLLTLSQAPSRRSETISIGTAVDNTSLYILDAQMRPAPLGVSGEICIAGIGVGRGYLSEAGLTADRFVPNPFGPPGDRLYRTGDLGRRRPDGSLDFVGRNDHQVKVRGYRIELGEIEARLRQHEDVDDAAVMAHEDERREKRLAAYVVPTNAALARASRQVQAELESSLVRRLEESLPEYMVPSHFTLLERMPLSDNGKIDRKALPAPSWQTSRSAFVAPRSDLERAIAEIWQAVLGVGAVGVHDRFFDLGGHSLLATQVTSRVMRRFDIVLPLRALFEASELGRFATRVAEAIQSRTSTTVSNPAPALVAVSRSGPLPLSPAQERLWFLWTLEPESTAYNIAVATELTGPLDRAALASALDAMALRHESLRTRFEEEGGRAVQKIDSPTGVALPIVEIAAGDEEVARQIEEESSRPFDLRRGPLFRARLLARPSGAHVLVLAMHHIVSDAWSMRVLVDELTRHYAALVEKRDVAIEPLPIQYADYAAWQTAWLARDGLAPQLAYWKEALGSEHPVLKLPTDRQREVGQRATGARMSFALSPGLCRDLRALAASTSSTLFVVVLAAFEVLLQRYSGQTSIRVGVPSANRNRLEIEGLIGFFINTHVIAAEVRPQDRFEEFLGRVRGAVLGAQSNPDYPFEKLVAELNPVRSLEHPPLFQVSYDHQVSRGTEVSTVAGLSLRVLERPKVEVPFDLSLVSEETASGGIEATFEYVRELFDAKTIARMSEHLVAILTQMAEDPSRPLASVILEGAREDERPLPLARAVQRDVAVHAWIRHRSGVTPHAIAVEFEGATLTYEDLEHQSNRLAHFLVKKGVRKESLVGICLPRSITLVVAMLAVMKAGGAYVPLDPSYPKTRIEQMTQDSGMAFALVSSSTRDLLGQFNGVDLVDLDEAPWTSEPLTAPVVRLHPDQLAYVIFTSGSTGAPKGVAVAHGSLTTHCQAIAEAYRMQVDDRALHFASVGFDAAVEQWIVPLMIGARLVMMGSLWSAEQAVTEIARLGITWFDMPPAYAAEVARWAVDHGRTLDLRGCTVGGEALPRATLELLQHATGKAPVINGYGPAESVVTPLVWEAGAECPTAYAPIGRAVGERTTYILDASLRRVPVGVVGELYIGGRGLARGYHGRSDLTADRFVPDPFGAPGGRLYRTGDLVRRTKEGELEFLGRSDHQVKIRGFRIELGEIEAQIAALPAVAETALVAREDRGTKSLVAYVVLRDPAIGVDVKAHLRERLPDYMVPAHVVVLPRLPLTPHGKVDRHALPAPEAKIGAGHQAPETDAERVLAGIWRDLLRVERVSIDDNFFELGGDSIISIQLVSRARDAGLALTPRSVFEHQTVRALAAACSTKLERRSDTEPTPGPVPFGPIQRAFFASAHANHDHYNQSILLETRQPLDAARLERALAELLAHHDALRMQFTRDAAGRWSQAYGPIPERSVLWVREAADARAIEAIADEAQRSLDIARGELVRAALIHVADGTTRLLLVVHHLVVDGVSWRILLEDLAAVYAEPGRLPAKTSSYQAWSRALERHAKLYPNVSAKLPTSEETRAWAASLTEGMRELPRDMAIEHGRVAEIASTAMRLDRETTSKLLREAPAAHRTQILDLLLTALAHAIEKWSGHDRVLVELETHGREDGALGVDTTRTVGWFTSLFPVALHAPTDLAAAIGHTKRALAEAKKHALAFASLDSAELVRPRITFNYLGQFEDAPGAGLFTVASESAGQERSAEAPLDNWLEVNGEIHDGQLTLTWSFSNAMYHPETVKRLADAYEASLRAIVEHCASRGPAALAIEDFPLAPITQGELDALALDPRDVEDLYALSPMQQGMVFHSLHGEDRSAYVNQYSVRAEGLDAARFEAALAEAVARHGILRTSIHWDGKHPVQVVHRTAASAVEFVDARALDAAALRDLAQREIARGFDLTKAPLTRAVLAKVGDDAYEIVWTSHHAILDGWSSAALIGEVLARCAGEAVPRAPVGHFGGFIGWLAKRDRLASERFWREELRNVDEPTKLASSIVRDPSSSHDGHDVLHVRMSGEAWQQVQSFARRERVTINTVVQGAWALVLSRRTGKDRVIFGATVSGRPAELAGADAMLGLFINTLPLAIDVPSAARSGAWLRSLQDKNLRMREHEEVPLYDVQRWAGSPGDTLFDTLVVFENYPVDRALREGPASIRFGEIAISERTTYALTLSVHAGDTLDVGLGYARAELDDIIAAHFARELTAAITALTTGGVLGALKLVDDEARRTQVEAVRGLVHTNGRPQASILEPIAARVVASPDAIAVTFEGTSLTYAELDARTNQLARYLRLQGVDTESLVGVHLERSLDLVVALLGVMKAGAAYVPLEPDQPASRITDMIAESAPAVVITAAKHRHALSLDRPVAWEIDSSWADAAAQSSEPVDTIHEIAGENLAYVIYTSGSTGKPKGAALPHEGLRNRLAWMIAEYNFDASDVFLQKTPFGFDVSVWEFFLPLMLGARLVVAAPGAHRDPSELQRLVAREGVTTAHFVPSMLRAFAEAMSPRECPSLRTVICSGEALPADLVDLWKQKHASELHNLYGPTEASIDVTAWACSEPRDGAIPIGRAIWNTRLYVLDAELGPVAEGATGELYIAGTCLARGYVGRADLTAERFLPDPFVPSERMYRTGDLARHTGGGVLEYLGRGDHQIKVRGVRIELGEIEAALREHARIVDAAAALRKSEDGEARIEAYVVLADEDVARPTGESNWQEELRAHLRTRLPDAMMPSAYVVLGVLPLTPSGKLDRKALLTLDAPRASSARRYYVAPADERELAIAAIWEEVLGASKIGRGDDFFTLGGHSLLAVQVTHRLRSALGIAISVRELFENSSLAALAQLTRQKEGSGAAIAAKEERDREIAEALAKVENMSVTELAALLDEQS